MALFRRNQPDTPPAPTSSQPAGIDLASALEIVLVKSVESQANMASKVGEVLTSQLVTLSEAFSTKFARKGGKARAAKAQRNPDGTYMRKNQTACRLCRDAAIPDPTAAEIIAHVNHRQALPPPPPPVPEQLQVSDYRLENGAVQVDVGESHIQHDSAGNEVLECPDCAKGIPHQHGVQ
jgi:ribosomal protein L14